jgi:hypothetical protein
MEETERDLLIKINTNVNSILERMNKSDEDINCLKIDNATNKEKLETVEGEIEKLRTDNKTHNWINSIALLIGSVLGIAIK